MTRTSLFAKLKNDPIGLLRRAWRKTVAGPVTYRTRTGGYDAARYWRDRFAQYGPSLRSVGDEGLSETENARQYEESAATFRRFCQEAEVELAGKRVLEIGTGTGFYTRLLYEMGVRDYVGVDVTDVFFANLRAAFPGFYFIQQDITMPGGLGSHRATAAPFDVVIMIDVIEHIVTEEKLGAALATIQNVLNDNGLFVVAPLVSNPHKHLFYVRFWSQPEVQALAPSFTWLSSLPFRSGALYAALKAPQS